MEKYAIHLFNLDDKTGKGREEFINLKNEAISMPKEKGSVSMTVHFYMKNRATEHADMDQERRTVDKDSWQEQWVRCEVLRKPPARQGKSTNMNNM